MKIESKKINLKISQKNSIVKLKNQNKIYKKRKNNLKIILNKNQKVKFLQWIPKLNKKLQNLKQKMNL